MATCPVCAYSSWAELVSTEVLRMETLMRSQFVYDRVPRPPEPEDRKDLTDFAHSAAASVLRCSNCGTLRREDHQEPVGTYCDDSYDRAAMDRLFPRYAAAFAAKEKPYRSLLPESANVLEIGPHLGGFLQTAKDWGWNAQGVDVGKDTAEYVNARGFTTHNCTVQECRYDAGYFDGVFIWNCFEQVPEPRELLREVRRIVKPGGIVVLRVPNALYYVTCRCYLASTSDPQLTTWITRALGFSNLLGWPYLYGYSDEHLNRLATAEGFARRAGLNAELIILPFPELVEEIVAEKRSALALVSQLTQFEQQAAVGRLIGPWIECVYTA